MGLFRCGLRKLKEDASTTVGNNTRKKLREAIERKVPILQWLPTYTLRFFLEDLLAGFTIALTEIPQGIAYAVVAGIPKQYGLYSGFLGCFVYAIIGSCKVINIGPTAIMALMVRSYVDTFGPGAAVLLCFLSGCFITVIGLLHLGFVVEFFSFPVTVAFTTAAAMKIASSQLNSLTGLHGGTDDSFIGVLKFVVQHLTEISKWDLLLGVTAIAFLIIVKEIGERYGTRIYRKDWTESKNRLGRSIYMFSLAKNAIVVIVTTSVAYVLTLYGYAPFALTGTIEGGLPSFKLPPFSFDVNGTYYGFTDMLQEYGTSVIFIPVIGVMEHVAIAKAFSTKGGLDPTQEFLSLGICNVMSSFVQAMPITGSLSRTAINNSSGAKTPMSGVFTGLLILFSLGLLTSVFEYIPKSTLAGIIITAMYYLCEFEVAMTLWRTKKLDLIPLVITLSCCLFISLEYGILLGVATNMIFVLYSSARPKLQVEEINTLHMNYYVVTPKTGLHFAAAEHVKKEVLQISHSDNVTIVINGEYLGNIDFTIAKSFHVLKKELETQGQYLVFWNFKQSVRDCITGIDKDLCHHFKGGALDNVVKGTIVVV